MKTQSIRRAAQAAAQPSAERRLSEHFTLQEMTRSGTAIRHGIDNTPPPVAVGNLQALCQNVLEPLRRRYGAIVITSGYRSEAVNQLVGGARHSQHLNGEAADIYIGSQEKGVKYAEFIIRNTDFDQLILEPVGAKPKRWLHVSYTRRRANRHTVVG